MAAQSKSVAEHMLREVIIDVANLPAEDLPLVAEFVEKLKQRPPAAARPDLSALRGEVHRKAAALVAVPREQLARQFLQLVDDLRAEAVANGVALDAEPESD